MQGKANTDNVYSSSQIDSSLSAKADSIDLYNKANSSDVYTKREVDTSLNLKANSDDVYSVD